MGFKDKLAALKPVIASHAANRSFKGLREDVKMVGQYNSEGMINMVTGFAAVAIVVAIVVVILASISESMPEVDNTSAYYGVQTTVETSTVSGLGLLVIVLIIIAAAIIMAAVKLINR